MKSKTSFFNRTVFKKNVTLYWPIWVCYLLYGMVKVPGQLWSRLQQQTDMTAYARDYALYNSLRLEVDVAAIAIMAVVCGMALFGYLFTQKNAYMIHALPVTRRELYVTNMISGLCFLLIPQALVFLVTVVLCLLKGIASVQFLGLWFLSVMGIAFFLYATVCIFQWGTLCHRISGIWTWHGYCAGIFDFADSLPDELSVQQCAVCIPAIL